MRKIQGYLNNILSAVYGRDVRQAVHDSIMQCYDDVSDGDTLADAAAAKANEASNAASRATTAAQAAAKLANSVVLDFFGTLDQLNAAHPVGNPGEEYAVGEREPYTVYAWSTQSGAWVPIGVYGDGVIYALDVLRRKVLAMSGGLYYLNKRHDATDKELKAVRDGLKCIVSAVVESTDSSTAEAIDIKCGVYGITLRLRIEEGGSYSYRIRSINNINLDLNSMYTSIGSGRQAVLREINIDNEVYEDFSALKTVGFEFRRLCLIYEAEGTYTPTGGTATPFTCLTTLCITPDGFTLMETVSDEGAVGKLPLGHISNASGAVKVKAEHGRRMVFGVSTLMEPPYPNTYIEEIEIEGRTSYRRVMVEGVG